MEKFSFRHRLQLDSDWEPPNNNNKKQQRLEYNTQK